MQCKLIPRGDGLDECDPFRFRYRSLRPVGVENIAERSRERSRRSGSRFRAASTAAILRPLTGSSNPAAPCAGDHVAAPEDTSVAGKPRSGRDSRYSIDDVYRSKQEPIGQLTALGHELESSSTSMPRRSASALCPPRVRRRLAAALRSSHSWIVELSARRTPGKTSTGRFWICSEEKILGALFGGASPKSGEYPTPYRIASAYSGRHLVRRR